MRPSSAELRSARWVGALFLLLVLFQRFALPGVPDLSLLVPIVVLWTIAAIVRRVVVVDQSRLTWWMAAAAVTAAVMVVQNRVVPGAQISITAWGLVVVVWLPATVKLVHRGVPGYLAMLRYVAKIATWLSVLTIAMVGTQLAGLPYRDWFAVFVPETLQLGGFVVTYPLTYGATVFRGNAWIGLEPSIVSAQLGIGLLAALFVRARVWTVFVLILGLVATASGSGIAIVAIGILVMLMHHSRRLLTRYVVLAGGTIIASTFTPFGLLLIGRTTEFQSSNSSASLRALQPYEVLIPKWSEHFSGVLLGYGPGSSQRLVTDTKVLGLLVPSPGKVFFEYGLIAGLVLAAFIFGCYWGGPSRAMSFSLLISLWVLQPGVTTMVFVAPVLVLVTLWSPRSGPPIESLLPEPDSRSADRKAADSEYSGTGSIAPSAGTSDSSAYEPTQVNPAASSTTSN